MNGRNTASTSTQLHRVTCEPTILPHCRKMRHAIDRYSNAFLPVVGASLLTLQERPCFFRHPRAIICTDTFSSLTAVGWEDSRQEAGGRRQRGSSPTVREGSRFSRYTWQSILNQNQNVAGIASRSAK